MLINFFLSLAPLQVLYNAFKDKTYNLMSKALFKKTVFMNLFISTFLVII